MFAENQQINRFKLSDTASLVMLWAGEVYHSIPALEFVNRLDLSAGQDLFRRCSQFCDWYGEVILNRKAFIYHLVSEYLLAQSKPVQIVLPAVGMSPLSLHLLALHGDQISHVLEIDQQGMTTKQMLYREIAPDLANRMDWLTADISAKGLKDKLSTQTRFDQHQPTVIILEGISYYLTPAELSSLLEQLKSSTNDTLLVLEYLLPGQLVMPNRRDIPENIFRLIENYAGIPACQCYTPKHLENLFASHTIANGQHYSLCDAEQVRTGQNAFFPTTDSGWIGFSTWRIPPISTGCPDSGDRLGHTTHK